MTVEEYITYIKKELRQSKVTLDINPAGRKKYAYFDHEDKVLSCCTKTQMLFQVLIHEYHHFLQWRDRPDYYIPAIQMYGKYFEWVDGLIKLSPPTIKKYYKNVIEVERDCELGALKQIKDLSLDVNSELYVANANTYLWAYYYITKTRSWMTTELYRPEIVDKMATKIYDVNYYTDIHNLPKNIQKIYREIFKL